MLWSKGIMGTVSLLAVTCLFNLGTTCCCGDSMLAEMCRGGCGEHTVVGHSSAERSGAHAGPQCPSSGQHACYKSGVQAFLANAYACGWVPPESNAGAAPALVRSVPSVPVPAPGPVCLWPSGRLHLQTHLSERLLI